MLTIIHGADFHLDAPFAALPPEESRQRRGEQRALLTRLEDLAARRRADLVLLSGDLLDSGEVYYETTQALARTLGQMRIPVVIAPGNHDFYGPRSPYQTAAWPENVHIFTGSALAQVDLPQLNCVVHGRAFTAPYCDTSPLHGFAAPRDGRKHLMCLHGDVAGTARYGNIALEDIAASGLDYLALGHVHRCSGLQRQGQTAWAYPGCPEGRGFDEVGEKGVLCVTLDEAGVQAEFVPLCQRRYGLLSVDMTQGDPVETLRSALPGDAQKDIYRVLLTGESDLEGLALDALAAVAAPYFYSVTLRDQTRVRRDLWARAQEDTLTGLFLQRMQARLSAAETDEARLQLEQAVRFGLAALENGEDCYP